MENLAPGLIPVQLLVQNGLLSGEVIWLLIFPVVIPNLYNMLNILLKLNSSPHDIPFVLKSCQSLVPLVHYELSWGLQYRLMLRFSSLSFSVIFHVFSCSWLQKNLCTMNKGRKKSLLCHKSSLKVMFFPCNFNTK